VSMPNAKKIPATRHDIRRSLPGWRASGAAVAVGARATAAATLSLRVVDPVLRYRSRVPCHQTRCP
jgi:hypothetical protein